ncbi:MAG: DUF456 domain-containing protein [Deltaproteobacteria bacterium]|nr:DUF456 domain-containing protein [Deltaproteobacteria bacterium]
MTLFILVLLFGTFSILFGLPGTVIILIDAAMYAAVTGFEKIGFKILVTLLILSILAELADFAVGMGGAVKFGASRKAFWASVVGGLIGAALMTPFLLGLGAVAGAFLGGFAGILIVELLRQKRLKPAIRAVWGAILGRAAGICVKGVFALIMVVITLTSVYN